jgi:putative tryptophan/tyrosine transport system substrate-binding protein
VTLAAHHRVPAAYTQREFAEAGGLMSYGPNLANAYQQTGIYTGRNDQLSGLSRENRPELQSAGAGYRVGVKTTGARSSWPDVKAAETITTSPFR